jgi:nitroreductase
MNVTDAVNSRKSTREFLKKPVPNKLISQLLQKASRSPSGGNLQPWKVYVINNDSMDKFLEFQNRWTEPEVPPYSIYPKNLAEPYRTYRYELGEQMYSLLNIPRDDKEARITQVLKNYNFFGAPAGLFCFVDEAMGPPQWSDLGMFLQTFMLLAIESGVDTCAQEAWSLKQDSVKKFLKIEDRLILFCGMAIGYQDKDAPINQLRSERSSIENWASFI